MTKRKKNQNYPFWLAATALVILGVVITYFARDTDLVLLNPKGFIANEQTQLMTRSVLILVAFAIPILSTLYFFVWRYRETDQKPSATHHTRRSKLPVVLAWAAPFGIMLLLASMMIPATFRLEPQDRIEAANETMTIQVVGLRWKWLFIYPDQQIATVNYVQIPEDTPVEFVMTADEAPFSAMWIPHLGGMMHVMTEHSNRLNLMADTTGDYQGQSTEINGHGFAGMKFMTEVRTQTEFDEWVSGTRETSSALTTDEYNKLLKPSENNPRASYSKPPARLYSSIIDKYAGGSHGHTQETSHDESHNNESHTGH